MFISVVQIYLKHWTEALLTLHALIIDLQLLKSLKEYQNIDDAISKTMDANTCCRLSKSIDKDILTTRTL